MPAYESLDRFFSWHGNPQVPGADAGIMDAETLMTAPSIVLTDRQIRKVQQIGYPKADAGIMNPTVLMSPGMALTDLQIRRIQETGFPK